MPFLLADGTSFALPTPKPTTPWPSPTTTSALKLRFLPPLTTFVTRLIDTTLSLISSCDASIFSRVRFISATLELQTCFARGFGNRLHAPVIKKSVAIEDNPLHALTDQPLGDCLANRLCPLDVASRCFLGKGPLDRGLDRRGRRNRPAARIVDHLHVHVRNAAEDRQPRALDRALHTAANPVLDTVAAIFLCLNPHRPSSNLELLRSGLPNLLLQHFARVAHALLLIRVRLAHPANVRRYLTDQLSIDAGHDNVRLLVDGDIYPGRDVEDHRVRIAEREVHLLALELGAVTDTDDVELLLEPLGHARDGVRDEAPGQAMELAQFVVLARELRDDRTGILREKNPRRRRLTQLALRALDFDCVRRDLHGHAIRNRNWFLAYSRHLLSFVPGSR